MAPPHWPTEGHAKHLILIAANQPSNGLPVFCSSLLTGPPSPHRESIDAPPDPTRLPDQRLRPGERYLHPLRGGGPPVARPRGPDLLDPSGRRERNGQRRDPPGAGGNRGRARSRLPSPGHGDTRAGGPFPPEDAGGAPAHLYDPETGPERAPLADRLPPGGRLSRRAVAVQGGRAPAQPHRREFG